MSDRVSRGRLSPADGRAAVSGKGPPPACPRSASRTATIMRLACQCISFLRHSKLRSSLISTHLIPTCSVFEPGLLARVLLNLDGASTSSLPTGAIATCISTLPHHLNAEAELRLEMVMRVASDKLRPLSSKASLAAVIASDSPSSAFPPRSPYFRFPSRTCTSMVSRAQPL